MIMLSTLKLILIITIVSILVSCSHTIKVGSSGITCVVKVEPTFSTCTENDLIVDCSNQGITNAGFIKLDKVSIKDTCNF